MSLCSDSRITIKKRFSARLSLLVERYKYYLIIGALIFAVPVAVGLAFAEGDGSDRNGEVSETQEIESDSEFGDGDIKETDDDKRGPVGGSTEEDEDDDDKEEEDEDEKNEGSEKNEENETNLSDEGEGSDALESDESGKRDDNLISVDPKAALATSSAMHPYVNGRTQYLRNNSSTKGYWRQSSGTRAVLPSYYDSRKESFGANIVQKNQHTEGLCWLYSTASTIEYYIAKNGLAATATDRFISPKHMDYQMVSASEAYKTSDVTTGASNKTYDRLMAWNSSALSRNLGDGGNDMHVLMTVANPLALMSEQTFTSAIKANDSNLSTISKYEDIWNNGLDSVLTARGEMSVYTVKQNYADMNDEAGAKFVVTGVKGVTDLNYGENNAKTAAVNVIKTAVKNYGAVSIGSFWDTENCMYAAFDKLDNEGYILPDENGLYQLNVTVIDRTTSGSGSITTPCNNGHQMTIVGWDDSFAYKDNDIQKTGAFIIQNSYTDTYPFTTPEDVTVTIHENHYMSYNSAIDAIYFDSVERVSDYGHYYSLNDYDSQSITADGNELVFEFTSKGKEILKEVSIVDASGFVDPDTGSLLSYDVFVSTNGTASGFVKKGTLNNSEWGINKLVFDEEIVVNGKFAIKIANSKFNYDDFERLLDVLTVFTDDIPEPESQTYTLVLNANGGSFPTGSTTTASCTTTGASCDVTVPNTIPTKENKDFVGWADSNSAATATYTSGGTISLSADNTNNGSKTIYAVYNDSEPESRTFSLTLNANGGSFAPGSTTTVECTTTGSSCNVTVPNTTPTNGDKVFMGWASSRIATVKQYDAGDTISLTANKTIYAIYEEPGDEPSTSITFTLTLDASGGSFAPGSTTTVECTTTGSSCNVTVPNTTPTNGDKVFMGWASSRISTVVVYVSGSTVNLTDNRVIYAVYSEPSSEPSNNAYLASLGVYFKVDGKLMEANLVPEFDKDVEDYEVIIPDGYDKDAFEDGIAVMVEGDLEDENASILSAEIVAVNDYVDLVTITVRAESGSKKIYEVTIYYPSPNVPNTGENENDNVPDVPNTGFMLRDRAEAKQSGFMIMLMVVVFGIVIGARVNKYVRRPKVENEAIIFVDK